MKSTLSFFGGSLAFCVLAVGGAYFFCGGLSAALTVLFLTVLETTLSFDNAVVNAGILKEWDDVWRRRFMTWGIVIAVFGMRLIFPLVVVAFAGGIGPLQTIHIGLFSPDEYSRILSSAHHQIAAFGATFLMMVFFSFFVARHKTEHWLRLIEEPLTRLGKMEAIEAALTLATLLLFSVPLEGFMRTQFIEAGIWGVVTYILSKGLGALLGGDEEGTRRQLVKQGVGGFLFLELIDASFSFDGVIGAFALTHNLVLIMLGLGAGAMFVRSFTLLLLSNRTLIRYRYLEHGAFWAIGALAVLMLLSAGRHIPEAVTGILGALLIAASLGSSIMANRKQLTKPS